MISPFELKIINQNFTVSEKKFFTSTTFNGLEEVATLMIVSLLFQGRWSMCQFFESTGLCRAATKTNMSKPLSQKCKNQCSVHRYKEDDMSLGIVEPHLSNKIYLMKNAI